MPHFDAALDGVAGREASSWAEVEKKEEGEEENDEEEDEKSEADLDDLVRLRDACEDFHLHKTTLA